MYNNLTNPVTTSEFGTKMFHVAFLFKFPFEVDLWHLQVTFHIRCIWYSCIIVRNKPHQNIFYLLFNVCALLHYITLRYITLLLQLLYEEMFLCLIFSLIFLFAA
jgi:hypothetical protein